jgi:hypothetical protein
MTRPINRKPSGSTKGEGRWGSEMGQAKRKRIATAMHEASHVVVGLDCGHKLVQCSIVPEDAFGGYGLGVGSTESEPIGDAEPRLARPRH